MKEKVWGKDEIKGYLEKSDKWVERGLVALYKKQTDDEQTHNRTKHRNNAGFNKTDAEFLTSCAKFFIENGFLTKKQIVYCRKKILKYSGQLAKIANRRI